MHACKLIPRRQGQEESWGLWTHSPVYLASSRPVRKTLSQKKEGRWYPRLSSGFHVHMYVSVCAPKHVKYTHPWTHTCKNIHKNSVPGHRGCHVKESPSFTAALSESTSKGSHEIGGTHLICLYLVARVSLILHFVTRLWERRRLLSMWCLREMRQL